MSRPTTPTLEDVATHAGVSTATVSRCLNSPERVVEATRKRVLDAVQDLGYAPNFGARALASRKTNTVGAIIPTMENAIFARGLQAFQEELQAHGQTLLVASSSYSQDVEESEIRTLVARGADGLLLIGFQRDEAVWEFLRTQRVPVVVGWAYDADQTVPSVGFDNAEAMRQMAQEVLAEGHRNLALITARPSQNDRARVRREALTDAVAGRNVSLTIIETDFDLGAGRAAFRALWQGPKQPTAILCSTDVLAVGALAEARAMGVQVPEDVSITGFGDIDLSQVASPALTTMHLPHRQMGRSAARVLLARMTGKDVPGQCLQTRLIRRATLGPPRAS